MGTALVIIEPSQSYPILQYKTQYIQNIGIHVANVALKIFVQLLKFCHCTNIYIFINVYLYAVVAKLIR